MVVLHSRLKQARSIASQGTLATALCALAGLLACDPQGVYVGSNVGDGGSAAHAGTGGGKPQPAGADAGKTGHPIPRTDDGSDCSAGFADCDGDASNGCEADLKHDRNHCGSCKTACKSADCVCQDGALVAECTGTRADCNDDASDGCEVDVGSDPNHCGTCTKVCPVSGFDAFGAKCVASHCNFVCEPGMADCDGDPSTGCEVFLSFDNNNCGACGVKCTTCNRGQCN